MKFSFKAKIYRVGINPCVKVPFRITDKLPVSKGYIYIRGTIGGFGFQQTLMPVKDSNYRLYVNGIMLKSSGSQPGDMAMFVIEQDPAPRHVSSFKIPDLLKKKLRENNLMVKFESLTDSRRKEILRYLAALKNEETKNKHIEKVISQLKKDPVPRTP